ncbi:hypothetical protein BJX63DRAFT_113508 [Aspergillus granulosus]|uniref:PD-(D/E)XK nuclease-like domain-containing protein n=1 Tax=Aspergillus granulosus TaxID=176169 RepID=A0ABR4GTS3_9EURO
MKDKDIIKWLFQAQSLASPSATASALHSNPTLKNQHLLPSPPESRKRHQSITDELNPTSKRQMTEEYIIEVDVDETPRASSSRKRQEYLPAPTESQSEQSQASGRSSPQNKLLAIETLPKGVEIRSLSPINPDLPPALSQLLREFVRCTHGIGFISNDLQAEIKEQSKQDPIFDVFEDTMFASQLGPTPSFNDVTLITKEAQECQDDMQSEAGWNMIVHYPLLHKAIYGQRDYKQKQLVGFTPCTTAKIILEYLRLNLQAKMVDFCIYIEPEMDDIAFNAILSLRRVLPCYVINHTDFLPLRRSPIAISIETKRQGGAQPATAELQLGTWHAAQWNLLEDLIARSGGSFDGLSFLPAVIVEGHDWSFAATTREGQKTVLWLEKKFGSTSDVVGVYKTVWGLQRLAKWASEVYWPWFRKNALGVSVEQDDA